MRKPAKQGQLDGAGGFYAATHALSILAPKIPREYIFEAVIWAAMQDGNPMNFVKGTRRGTVKNILSRTIALLNAQFTDNQFDFSIPYWQSQPEDRKAFFSTFDNLSHKNGMVAIIGYAHKPDPINHYHHWTVVREFDGECFTTFDSGGEKIKIGMSEMRVNDPHFSYHSAQPYFMNSDDIFLVTLA
ncbi:MAG: hypothetical protein WC216_06195 [Gallionella sp.]